MLKSLVIALCTFLLVGLPTLALDYSQFDKNDIDSICQATKAYQNEFDKKRGTKEAEKEFLEFLGFYNDFVKIQSSKIVIEPDENEFSVSCENIAKKYSDDYFSRGMIVHFDEGEFFLVRSNKYLYNEFATYLTEDWQELLNFEIYFDKRVIYDGRLIIPVSEVKEIVRFYKHFLKKYPNFVEKNLIRFKIESYSEDLKNKQVRKNSKSLKHYRIFTK